MTRWTAVENPPIRRLALCGDGVEHRLHVDRRRGDDLQYLGRRRLLLAGFLQVLLGSEIERRLTRVAAGAMRRLVLVVLRPFAEPALRAFAALVLPPVLDGRAISAPRVRKGILSGQTIILEGPDQPGLRCLPASLMSGPGPKPVLTASKRHFRSTPNNGHHQTGPAGPFSANRKTHAPQQLTVYSITSSASASSVGGTVRPSALAVFRLTNSSIPVGCSMGSSPASAPSKTFFT